MYKMRFVMEWIIVFISLMSTCSLAESVNNCTTVDDDLRTCYSIYAPAVYVDLNYTWEQNCENIECFLQCMSDAIGDCYLTDKYFTYEMTVLTVNYRASCANLNVNVASLLMCQPYNVTCLFETNAYDALIAAVDYFNNTDYAMYREAYCNYTRLQQTCISADITESCNTTIAEFYRSILTVSTSLSQCGNEQSHEYFTIYNSSLNCVNPYTIGTTQESTSTSQTSVTTSSFFLTPSSISLSSVTSSPVSAVPTTSSVLFSSTLTLSSSSLSTPSSMASSTSPTQSTSTLSATASSTTTSLSSTSSSASSTPSASSSTSSPTTTTSTSATTSLFSSFFSSTSSLPYQSSSVSSTSASVNAETLVSSTVEQTSLTSSSTNTLGCSYSEMISRLEQCITVSMDSLNTSTPEQTLKNYCDNIECNVQCYINSVGECYKEDHLFTFDTETAKVLSRSYCNNYTETLSAIETCYFDDQTCFSSFYSSYNADILTLYINGNYMAYRQQYCSLLSTLQSCLSGSTVSGCGLQQANLLRGINVVSLSYSKCGEQNHAYFTTYGYDVTCGSNACLSNSFGFFVAVFVTFRKYTV